MGIFTVQPAYNRAHVLGAASKARAERRLRKAASLYRRVLAVEPDNLEVHFRLAPLLAARRLDFDAWASFARCARAALRDGELERAAAVYREAVRCLPQRVEAWEKLARIEFKLDRKEPALEILLEGRQYFRGRRWRSEAIALLRRIRDLEPHNFEVLLDLCGLLARSDQESEAQLLLDRAARRATGTSLQRIRWAQWRIAPTLAATWLWLKAAFRSARDAKDGAAGLAEPLPRPHRIAA
jgi:tetratricopeptide (TPR) repeat protein